MRDLPAFPKPRVVRLKGSKLDHLRQQVFYRDGGKCTNCGRSLVYNPESIFQPNAYHMAHKRNKRMWGDTLENTHAKCSHCHLVIEHGGDKPCPAKS